jgi:hypothetical protein
MLMPLPVSIAVPLHFTASAGTYAIAGAACASVGACAGLRMPMPVASMW